MMYKPASYGWLEELGDRGKYQLKPNTSIALNIIGAMQQAGYSHSYAVLLSFLSELLNVEHDEFQMILDECGLRR